MGDIDRNGERWARQLRSLAASGRPASALQAATYRLLLFASQVSRVLGLRSG
jgi:hypothetical protein